MELGLQVPLQESLERKTKGKAQRSESNNKPPSPTNNDGNQKGRKQQKQEPSPMESSMVTERPSNKSLQGRNPGIKTDQTSSHNGAQDDSVSSSLSGPSIAPIHENEKQKQFSQSTSQLRLHDGRNEDKQHMRSPMESKEEPHSNTDDMSSKPEGQKPPDGSNDVSSTQQKTPTSTNDIPMPNQNRTEQRTIGQFVRDQAKERIQNNAKVRSAKRTYNLSRNTTENWKNKIKKRGQG